MKPPDLTSGETSLIFKGLEPPFAPALNLLSLMMF
jgi:hypothetical protein